MPDLETFLAQWRQKLSAVRHLKPGTLDELESHLRDRIAEHMRSGLAEADACQRAAAELGSIARGAVARVALIRKPNYFLRGGALVLCLGFVAGVIAALRWQSRISPGRILTSSAPGLPTPKPKWHT